MAPKLNKDVKSKWVKRLRELDPKKQGRFQLKNAETRKMCCLGVLCELAVEEGIIPPPVVANDKSWDKRRSYLYGENRKRALLPVEVSEWAFTTPDHTDPLIGDTHASLLNDITKLNFKQIADRIDKYL